VFNHTGRKKTVKEKKLAECINKNIYAKDVFFIMAEQSHSGLGNLILGVSKSGTVRHTTCGKIPLDDVISPSQRPIPDRTQHSQGTDIYIAGGNRTCNTSKRATADLPLRPRSHNVTD
jgi:hypothetical protein